MFNLALYIYSILLGFAPNSQSDQNIHNLNITVSEFESYNGVLRVCITDNKADFLESCLYSKSILIDNNSIEIEFKNLKMGVYAVSVYQDENSNGVLETDGLFGLPSEPFGFSNNLFCKYSVTLVRARKRTLPAQYNANEFTTL